MDSGHYINRELSWLAFNQRVLEEAVDVSNPLLERLKFYCIVSSNLDEFFEVRVAGLKQQMDHQVLDLTPDGRTAQETFKAVARRTRRMLQEQFQCWNESLVPSLKQHAASATGRAIHSSTETAPEACDGYDAPQP